MPVAKTRRFANILGPYTRAQQPPHIIMQTTTSVISQPVTPSRLERPYQVAKPSAPLKVNDFDATTTATFKRTETHNVTLKEFAHGLADVFAVHPAFVILSVLYIAYVISHIVSWIDWFGWDSLLLLAACSIVALPQFSKNRWQLLGFVAAAYGLLRIHRYMATEEGGLHGILIFPSSDATVPEWLHPVYNQPAWRYSLSILVEMGIQNILVFAHDKPLVYSILGTGKSFGVEFWYGEKHSNKFPVGFLDRIPRAMVVVKAGTVLMSREANFNLTNLKGARIFAVESNFTQGQAVVEHSSKGDVIVDFPHKPDSNWVIPSVFVFDGQVRMSVWKAIRGILPWSELVRMYQRDGELTIQKLTDASWTDMTCPDTVLSAANFARAANGTLPTVESLAAKNGWINGHLKRSFRQTFISGTKAGWRLLGMNWIFSSFRLW
jgi:dTDP-glucose pyrophosphorylase